MMSVEDKAKARKEMRESQIPQPEEQSEEDNDIMVILAAQQLKNIGERAQLDNGHCVLTNDDIAALRFGMIALQVVDPHLLLGGDEDDA